MSHRDFGPDGPGPAGDGQYRVDGGAADGRVSDSEVARFVADVVVPNEARLGRVATAILGDPSWAEDVVADALVAYWRRSRIASIGRPEAYLYRTVVNRAKWYRRRRALLFLSPSPPDLAESRDTERAVVERQACLAALAKVPMAERTVLVLAYLEDRSEAAIAELLGVPAGTVKSRLARGRRRLRAELGDKDES